MEMGQHVETAPGGQEEKRRDEGRGEQMRGD